VLGAAIPACSDRSARTDIDSNPSLTQAADVRIDGYAANLVPFMPSGVAVTPAGSVFVAQPQDRAVRVFDQNGGDVATLGRSGAGPAEFRSVSRLGFSGDSLWVWDGSLRRVSVYSLGNLRYERSINYGMPASIVAGPDARFTLESFAVLALLPKDDVIVFGSDSVRSVIARISAAGESSTILATLTTIDEVPKIRAGNSVMDANQFPSTPKFAMTPDGRRLVYARAFLEGERANTFSVTAVDLNGDTIFSRLYPFEPDPISRAVADSIISVRAARLSGALAAAFRSDAYVPPAYPPILGLAAGWDGSIWLEMRGTGSHSLYMVLDSAGNTLAELTYPAGIGLAGVGDSVMWGIVRDENDVQSVVRYRRDD
jgi:hypothetical protein